MVSGSSCLPPASYDTLEFMSANEIDMKLEVVVISVSDVDRAKKFYAGLGWRLDADFPFDNGIGSGERDAVRVGSAW